MPFQLPGSLRLHRFRWIPVAGFVFGAFAGLACVLTDNPLVDIHQTHPSAEGAVFKVDLLGVNVVEEAYTVEVAESARRRDASRHRGRDRRSTLAQRDASEKKSREFNSRSRPWIIAVSVAGAVFFGLLGWLVAFVGDRLIPRAAPGEGG